ncbi:MAG: hypothetical protein K6E88_05035 [Lachnospiraceae bacterium]|nr:hypothetical protein [Lachnospiraceae bacterium]
MAKKKRMARLADPRIQKRMKRDEALMQAAVRRARAERGVALAARSSPNVPNAGNTGSSGGSVQGTVSVSSNLNKINGTADIKEAVKEVIVNNSTDSSRVAELLDNNNKRLTKRQRQENDAEIMNAMQNDDMKVLASLLMQMRDKDERKLKYTKVQVGFATFTSILALLIAVFIGIAVLTILPQLNDIIAQANDLIAQTNTTIVQANDAIVQANQILNDVQPVVDNLNTVTNDLASADITGMLKDVDNLVVSSEKNMSEALQTITDIDIKSLNDAIADLSAIVAPLSSMFRR